MGLQESDTTEHVCTCSRASLTAGPYISLCKSQTRLGTYARAHAHLSLRAPTSVFLCLECSKLLLFLGAFALAVPSAWHTLPGTFTRTFPPSIAASAPGSTPLPREVALDPQALCHPFLITSWILFICLPFSLPITLRVNPECREYVSENLAHSKCSLTLKKVNK